jgi:hypothetical protein
MSFFDDDEPIRASRTRPPRPRAAAAGGEGTRVIPGGSGGGRGGGTRGPDPATVRQRQFALGGVTLLVLIVLVFVVNSCQSSAKEDALKGYNRSVTEIATDSDTVGRDLFSALSAARAGSGTDVEVRVNQLGATQRSLVTRAHALEPRDEMKRAQNDLELVMNLRAEGLRKIADRLPSALVTGRDRAQSVETSLSQIAGQMQQFLASDVVYSQRVAPYISEALAGADITGQRVVVSRFLPSLAWLNPNTIADRLGAQRAGGGTGGNPNPAPGLHGHGLTSVTVGSVALQPGGASNRVPARPAPQFTVKLANGGDNDETDVTVSVTVTVKGGRPIVRKKTIAQTKAKTDATVTIPLGTPPPSGTGTVVVSIAKVPGETGLTNNKQTYTVLFTG